MKPVNLKTLAQELNLSVATVSRALNDRFEISQPTKDRVLRLAAQRNYLPNPHASSLRRSQSKTIGVVIPEVANHFFALAINGIEEVARLNDYHVLIYLTHDDDQREAAIVRLLASGRVDGVLLSGVGTSRQLTHLNLLLERHIPLVFFDRVYEGLATATVTTDDYASGYQATRHLLEAGCRTIAHLTLSPTISICQRRRQGYQAALREFGLSPDKELLLEAKNEGPANERAIEALLRRRRDIDGIFTAVESLAMSSYQVCQNLGLRIPTDIKIISFSNSATAALLLPPLTTITQPAHAIGKAAAEIIFQGISKNCPPSPTQSLELKSELFARASSAATPSLGRR